MSWELVYIPEALDDLKKLDGSQRILVRKALAKTLQNPLSKAEGGYGSPLHNTARTKLSGLLKIKLRGAGLRIVYKLEKVDEKMIVIVIGVREDNEVYEIANQRIVSLK